MAWTSPCHHASMVGIVGRTPAVDKKCYVFTGRPQVKLQSSNAKFHVYRSNVSHLHDEKPIFGPLSKNNTGMAVLHAGLMVMRVTISRTEYTTD